MNIYEHIIANAPIYTLQLKDHGPKGTHDLVPGWCQRLENPAVIPGWSRGMPYWGHENFRPTWPKMFAWHLVHMSH